MILKTIYNDKMDCKVLFSFNYDDKDIVVYLDDDNNFLASFYKVVNDEMIIYPISEDKYFDAVDREISRRCMV